MSIQEELKVKFKSNPEQKYLIKFLNTYIPSTLRCNTEYGLHFYVDLKDSIIGGDVEIRYASKIWEISGEDLILIK